MIRSLRRAAAAAAGLTVAALALSGCVSALIPDRPADPVPVTEGVPGDLVEFYDQPPVWEDCGPNLQCTTITAPLDWNDPDLGEIELAVNRYLAEGGAPQGAMLTNPGGPGASGVDFVAGSAEYLFGEDLRDAFDIVGFDPRGVGASTAVTCLDDAGMDAYLYDIPENERGTTAWERELEEQNAAFAAACDENSGDLLEFTTTEQAARDLDLIRGVLGQEGLRYLGFSYGTFLGATYAELFPDRADHLVLDAAMDPSVPSAMVGAKQGVGFENALRGYLGDCGGAAGGCPFTGNVDDGMADLSALLASVDEHPLPVPDGRELGADSLMTGIIAALYSPASWPTLTDALVAAQDGDGSGAMALADMYNDRVDGTYVSNTTEAFTAYNCMDYPPATPAEEKAAEALVKAEAPTIAPYWFGPDGCAEWPHEPTGARGEIHADGSAPILVVGTTGDPATPYEWAESLADQLTSGTLITYEGEGHGGYGNSACVNDAVGAFLIDGTTPDEGLTCR
ncbi:alpha/beta hydrolase [Microbacterium halophytorum]|uniref:alpha/beta hydrolase n=1 Tax=Microbacterium halophytorum TaxID=2067568 RepID=UPI000CFC4023|nr:alpha/beta hydrolase [Microbacterium halophytorum]